MDRVIKAARTAGSLNLSNRSLREVPEEIYQNFETAGEGDKWWEAVDLQKLILAHNNIEVLREDLRNLPMLAVLNVSHNNLTKLPAAIGELALLKSLDVSHNSIASLPEEIGSATSLVKIDCSNNQLKELPDTIGICKDLSELKASNNNIQSLPDELVKCKKLMKLEVEGNKLTQISEQLIASWTLLSEVNASKNLLTSIPESMGGLSRLVRLDLHQNRISSIPSSIKGCASLAEFFMGNNLLSSVPGELGELSRLGTLDLHSNQLKEFPAEACKLRLLVLDLSNNSLSGLPAEMGLMTSLRRLVLTGNPMRTIRSTLVAGPTPALLKYLASRLPSAAEANVSTPKKEEVVAMAARLSITSKEILLGGTGLVAVPSEVLASPEVTKIDLSKNAIEELPLELSSCSSLEVLILSGNKIKVWPGEVLTLLPKLSCLKMNNNPLQKIPSNGFEAVSQLQILDLSGCTSSLPEDPSFSSIPHLVELYLRRIQLREVPSDILGLQHLKILDLSQNSLQSVPEGFKNMSSLTELDLSDNCITSLPPQLGLLEPTLQALRLDGNPLRSIRRTILDRGTKAILKYLQDKL